MTLSPLGDSAVLISLGEHIDDATARQIRAIAAQIEADPPTGTIDVVPAFASVAVFYDSAHGLEFSQFTADLEERVARARHATVATATRKIEIPVCYGGEFGPDLEAVAQHAGMKPEAVIAAHSGADYLVHAIGFVPGFPYLGGLPPRLATPRRATPRPAVPAGSVGIGGSQTGVYPFSTPGGWNLIGRTPAVLFDVTRPEPALLEAGDRVRFRAISGDDYAAAVAAAARPYPKRGDTLAAASSASPAVDVVRAGMFSTVQDLGRSGHRARGVPNGGAADLFAARVANLLAGNPEHAALLEFTLVGPELRFGRDTVIGVTGGDFGVPRWRPLLARAGETVKFGAAVAGARGYVAFAGGVEVPAVLGSRSTYLRGQFGGFEGRTLRDGDRLTIPPVTRGFAQDWRIDPRILPAYSNAPTVRVVAGVHAAMFREDCLNQAFTVTPRADRMGVCLAGDALRPDHPRELVSLPVAPGAIQVPPDGQPIVLLVDAQTVGGYPQVANVIAADLPLIAQLRPGDSVHFRLVTLDEAHAALRARERALGLLREGLAQKLA